MLYEESEKKSLERACMRTIGHIRESPYLGWFWFNKLRYLLQKINGRKWYIMENIVTYMIECFPKKLINELQIIVKQIEQTANFLEQTEIKRHR